MQSWELLNACSPAPLVINLQINKPIGIKESNSKVVSSERKGIEFLSQNLIFLSRYLCISMSETLDISNYEFF